MKQIFELVPTNGRKSFGGKAKVIVENGVAKLLSYTTIVAEYKIGEKEYKQIWEGKSNTTNSHIKAFKDFYGV